MDLAVEQLLNASRVSSEVQYRQSGRESILKLTINALPTNENIAAGVSGGPTMGAEMLELYLYSIALLRGGYTGSYAPPGPETC